MVVFVLPRLLLLCLSSESPQKRGGVKEREEDRGGDFFSFFCFLSFFDFSFRKVEAEKKGEGGGEANKEEVGEEQGEQERVLVRRGEEGGDCGGEEG